MPRLVQPEQVSITAWTTKRVLTLCIGALPLASTTTDDPFIDKFESMTRVPILTCFVPSLTPGTPFRTSIHSWAKPCASTILQASLAIPEEVCFQVRLYMDGMLQR